MHELLMLARMMIKRRALLRQCPAPNRVDSSVAAALPIHVERFGDAGPRLLFIHGGVQGDIGGGPKTFARQSALADQGWRIEIVDRPGFGRSPTRGVDDMIADSVWIADRLQDGAHLIGYSWGGAAALLAAARRPEAVLSLVLVEPALQGLAMTDAATRRDPKARALLMTLPQLFLNVTTPASLARAFIKTLVGLTETHTTADSESIDEAAAARCGCAFLQARIPSPRAFQKAADIIRGAGIRTLTISGGWNPAIEIVAQIAARRLGGRHVTVPSPNHFPQLENAAAFNQSIDAFVRERTAARKANNND